MHTNHLQAGPTVSYSYSITERKHTEKEGREGKRGDKAHKGMLAGGERGCGEEATTPKMGCREGECPRCGGIVALAAPRWSW